MDHTFSEIVRNRRLVANLACVYVVWGSTYLAIRVMVETIPPLIGAGARFLGAGLVVGGVLLVSNRRQLVQVSAAQTRNAAVIGALVLVGGIGLVTVAEQDVASSLTALLVATIPLWVIVLRVVYEEGVSRATVGSVVLGFAGLALLLLPQGGARTVTWTPLLLVVAAAALTALGAFYAERWELPGNPLVASFVEMMTAGIVLTATGVLGGEWNGFSFADVTSRSLVAFVYLLIVGSVVAYSSFAWLLKNAPVSLVATYAYVNPVIALILGVVVLSEKVSLWMLAGATVIVASVANVVSVEGTRRSSGPDRAA